MKKNLFGGVLSAIEDARHGLLQSDALFSLQQKVADIEGLGKLASFVRDELVNSNKIFAEQALGINHHRAMLQDLTLAEALNAQQPGIGGTALEYARMLNEQFRLPQYDEAMKRYDFMRSVSSSRIADSLILQRNEFANLVASLKSPWVDITNSFESFESIDRLAAVGKAVLSAAYDSTASDTLRSLLGEWPQGEIAESMFSDWRIRQDFYFTNGFDKLLTALPEPAFTASLYETGILRDELFQRGYPVVESLDLDEETEEVEESFIEYRGKQRIIEAHEILFSLETSLRVFLYRVMAKRFGSGWEKRRVSPEVCKTWQEKRETAKKNGATENRLLWYADFSDYIKVIERNDNWREVFEPFFRNRMDVQVSFWRLGPIRISAAHYRTITKEDHLLLGVESQRILKAIGMIDNDEEDF